MKGKRTVLANVAFSVPIILDIAVQFAGAPEFVAFLPEEWLPFYGLVMVGANIFLRSITTTPMWRAE